MEVEQSLAPYTRKALICYEGQFESLDGPVIVDKQSLELIAANYNGKVARATAKENGVIKDKYLAPLQLDHKETASETIGRVMGNLTVEPYTTLEGKEVYGLYGDVKISGADNIEKVEDGRWSNLSIGADFDKGVLSELTVTPFPAAAEASLLSTKTKGVRLMNMKQKCMKYMTSHKGMNKEDAEEKMKKMSEEEMKKMAGDCDKMMDKDEKKMSNAEDMPSHLAEGEEDKMAKGIADKAMSYMSSMMDEYMKKKMSNAEDMPSHMSDGEVHVDIDSHKDEDDEEMKKKKMGQKETEKMNPEGESPKAKMSNAEDMPSHMADGEEKDEKKMADKDADPLTPMGKKYMKMLMDDGMEEEKAMAKCKKMADEDIKDAINKHEKEHHTKKKMSGDTSDENTEATMEKVGEVEKEMGKKKKMSSPQAEKFKKLSAKMKTQSEGVKLGLVKAKITNRLSALKASAKITPAEISKLDIDKLAQKDSKTLDDIFTLYENREPVIHAGVMGTHKALDLSQLSAEIKKVNLKKAEEESLSNMSFTGTALKNMRKGNTDDSQLSTPVTALSPSQIDETKENIAKLLEQDKLEDVKSLMDKTFNDIKKLSVGSSSDVRMSSSRIDEIERSVSEMSESYNEIVKLLNEVYELE